MDFEAQAIIYNEVLTPTDIHGPSRRETAIWLVQARERNGGVIFLDDICTTMQERMDSGNPL